ncbi:uncharacterized protein LOC142787044 [Rhipicephalus microplus]
MRIRGTFMFLLFTLVHSGHSYTKQYEDISKFYSTSAKIVTLYTTMGEGECKTDKVTHANQYSADFQRKFHNRAKKQPLNLVGKFINDRYVWNSVKLDAMDVRKKNGGEHYSYERLFNVFDSYTCGIFFVSKEKHRGGSNYELRVKKGTKPNGKCYDKFMWHTKSAGVASKITKCRSREG